MNFQVSSISMEILYVVYFQVSVKLANNVNFTFVDANGNDFNPGPDGWTKVPV